MSEPDGLRGWHLLAAVLSLSSVYGCARLAILYCADHSSLWMDLTALPVLLGLGAVGSALPVIRYRSARPLGAIWVVLGSIGALAPWVVVSRALCWWSAA